MPTRDLSNKRITIWVGNSSSVANLQTPSLAEINAMLMISDAIRFNGFDFGSKASSRVDDRSLSDDGGATIRGFAQFGGGLPLFYPKKADSSSILRQVFNLVKAARTPLIIVERVGFKSTSAPIAAGDNVNVYRVLTDGFDPDTSGDGGYAYLLQLLPQGDVYPWTIVPAASPATLTVIGGATLALTVAGGVVGLRGAAYQGSNVTPRCSWSSSAPNIATVDNRGIIKPIAAGSTNILPTFPGAAAATPVAVTVT